MFPDTPQTLLKRISELSVGDNDSEWEAFVELYTPPLTRFVRLQNHTLSDADVEDVVQDVFVRLVEVLRQGKIDHGKAKFRAYLATVTRRILIDRYRAEQVRPKTSEEPISFHDESSYNADASDPGVAVDAVWRMAVRMSAKNHIYTKTAISDQSKRIYDLIERGLSPQEVAQMLGVSHAAVKQVKSRIDRAIAAIEQRCHLF